MSDDLLIHDHSILLTGATIGLLIVGEIALLLRARPAAVVCALTASAMIFANVVVGRPVDVAFGPFVGIEPQPAVDDAIAFGRLAMSQTVLLAVTVSTLITAWTNERPRMF